MMHIQKPPETKQTKQNKDSAISDHLYPKGSKA
jgi:hypothetical protein